MDVVYSNFRVHSYMGGSNVSLQSFPFVYYGYMIVYRISESYSCEDNNEHNGIVSNKRNRSSLYTLTYFFLFTIYLYYIDLFTTG